MIDTIIRLSLAQTRTPAGLLDLARGKHVSLIVMFFYFFYCRCTLCIEKHYPYVKYIFAHARRVEKKITGGTSTTEERESKSTEKWAS